MDNPQAIWQAYKRDKDPGSREQLIVNYLPLVRHVAGRLAMALPPQVDVGDLESYGLFGLIEAIERFDLERGVKFETYAVQRIRGAMLDGLRAETWAPALRQKARQLEKAHSQLEADLGRSPSDEEVASHLNISAAELARHEAALGASVLLSLDEGWTIGEDGEGLSITERLADTHAVNPEHEAMLTERKETLATAIDKLPEKERLVVTLLYYEGLTAKEIAGIMSLSVARISQLHSKAILRLRGRLSRHRQYMTTA